MLPICIAAGCSYEEYWHGDPWLARAYIDAQTIRNKAKNEELWLQGRYVFDAIMCAIANVHLDGKNHKFVPYIAEPYDFEPKKELADEDIEKGRAKVAAQLEAWMATINAKFKDKQNG